MILDVCTSASFILRIAVKVVKYLHFIIPVILIVMIMFDFAKAMTNGQLDEKTKKEATDKAIKRIIYASIVFLIPTIINFAFTKIDELSSSNNDTPATSTTAKSWMRCWVDLYRQ